MTCRKCQHQTVKKFGFNRNKTRRYRCTTCSATFSDSAPAPFLAGHTIDEHTVNQVLFMMLEGMSVRSISRIMGLHKNTILSLMLTASENAQRVFDARVRNVRPKFVQLDELWAMVGCHGKNVRVDSPADWGDQWTWLALDSDTKMILSYHIGPRNTVSAYKFVRDLSERTLGVYQITSDALRGYVGAIEEWYGNDVHFAQLQKIYGRSESGPEWYGGGTVIAAVPKVKTGSPDFSRISTSHIERCNLSVRMHNRRYARKMNAISKRLVNLKAAIALWVVWYNFCRTHQTLRVTPAMEAGITDHVWSLAELIGAA
ncbi:MAG TPA: IS1 family transposase [Candidatus Angelobacter sp.]|nr:IS1 family transposase [Candidatus Angelobacter sp.]